MDHRRERKDSGGTLMTDFELSLELDHPGLVALILLPYRDSDDWEPQVLRWIIRDGEDIPGDPARFMLEKLAEEYRDKYPDENWTPENMEENVRIGLPIVFLLRGY